MKTASTPKQAEPSLTEVGVSSKTSPNGTFNLKPICLNLAKINQRLGAFAGLCKVVWFRLWSLQVED